VIKTSIIIPFRNEFDSIGGMISHLKSTLLNPEEVEIIIVNDGSFGADAKFKPLEIEGVTVIQLRHSYGVGASFDRGVELAKGDVIILTASDVYPFAGWYEKVIVAVEQSPNSLGCATCVGLNPKKMDLYNPKNTRRYGADLLFYVTEEDLPESNARHNKRGSYTSIMKAKWLPSKQQDAPYEIPCILGAFYFTSKAYYKVLGGWDTIAGDRFCGHKTYGSLEPYISLKSWLVGGGCILYPDIEAGHVFSRIVRRNRWTKGVRNPKDHWWNQLFILETMILDEGLRQRLYDFIHFERAFHQARVWIKKNQDAVVRIREANRQKFKYDHTLFTTKFNYDFNIK
jgi:glycosyltransferase involved in cell wall biosynthesis